MIAVVDYGVGNLYSLASSLAYVGLETKITRQAADLEQADKIILPGVGAFGDAAEKLRDSGLRACVREQAMKGKPFLGICLGMQLLFEKSFEYGEHEGLGLISGSVGSLAEDFENRPSAVDGFGCPLKVPHMGWNRLELVQYKEGIEQSTEQDPIFKYIEDGSYVYYVHSFYAKKCVENTIASSIYDVRIPGVVRAGNVYGMQFHPEKSGQVGLNLLRAFGQL